MEYQVNVVPHFGCLWIYIIQSNLKSYYIRKLASKIREKENSTMLYSYGSHHSTKQTFKHFFIKCLFLLEIYWLYTLLHPQS
ncbi:hypothetical protein CR513_25741, partial [Mucuna pruriens]